MNLYCSEYAESRTKPHHFSHFCYEHVRKLAFTNILNSSGILKNQRPRCCIGAQLPRRVQGFSGHRRSLRAFAKSTPGQYPLGAGSAPRPNHSKLNHLAAAKQDIERLAFVELGHGRFKVTQLRDFGVADLQNHIALAQASAG